MGHGRQLTINRVKTTFREHCNLFFDKVRSLVQTIGTLEDVVDGLGVGDPQTFFLHYSISEECIRPDLHRRSGPQAAHSSEPRFRILQEASSQ